MSGLTQRRSALSMTAKDHAVAHSTPPDILLKYPGKTLLEILSSNDLQDRISSSIATVEECHQAAQSGGAHEVRTLEIARDMFLVPDIDYLREQECLPGDLEDFDPRTVFAL